MDALAQVAPAFGKRRIGSIVAGSLIAGFVAALVLILGPFAGAPENVISGMVLLAFAGGWALLAVLSTRWTDQPQPWAVAPAGLMGIAGGLLLIWPGVVLADAFGWVWPPLVIALVIWMTRQSRQRLQSRIRPWFLYPVFGVLALAAMGGGYEMIREALDRSMYAMPGQLVDVGGHRLHLNCTGAGSPTVVLEAGAGEMSSALALIGSAVARDTQVCVYDRAGKGWSEAAAAPQDGVALATDLHALLDRAHVAGPYVLAGHSFGGLYVLNFAARYPNQVAGMVLLDSSSPEQFSLPGYPTFYNIFRRASAVLPSLARLGVGRLFFLSAYDTLPASARDTARAFGSTARQFRSTRDEFAEAPTVMQQAQRLTSLGDKPLIVLTAVRGAQEGWLPAQDKLATLSTNRSHRLLPNTTHASLIENQDDAATASQAIREVVVAVRAGTPLAMQ